MKITSAKFIRGINGDNTILEDGLPQIAFIGRSNVGKSSLINSLTGFKKLAISSKMPGRTQEINIFLINNTHYFLDLPGYGFTKTSTDKFISLGKLIFWYLFKSNNNPKIVLLIDAQIGPTDSDLEMLHELEKSGKNIILVLNKIDKIKKSQYENQLKKIKKQIIGHKLFPYSSKSKIGKEELIQVLLTND